ncbi:cob(I)yrinic acid a,c-diamide adenosyltransferase [Massilioclostridium coli]|uniref:cob(I)yrinic acid a,c-diamide adenosyltransferase n=1 Tax=Massilioclostridium coli TaxID=1870991 RepID=UPI0022E0E5FC|nr:cob(I)yrinic acid a,c-diamide adenosyltransferase [Massilioclostridium coli]
MSIYTRNGDTGFASTKNRMRIPKNSPVFKLLGALDEFSSALGLSKQKLPQTIRDVVEQIQQDVIAISGEIAGGEKFTTKEKVDHLEQAIDSIMTQLPEIKSFILPGETEGGAALDLARTVVRRAEREAVAASQMGGMSRDTIAWLNRISDLVYALARMADFSGGTPISKPEEETATSTPVATPAVAVAADEKITVDGNQFCDKAERLCEAVMTKARAEGLGVVTAVCDKGANLVAFKRDDNAFLVSIDVAINKAYTSASLKMTTEEVAKLTEPGAGLEGLQYTTNGKLILFGGGVPLYDSNGELVGALGVSGGTADQDKGLAEYGAQLFTQSF